VIPTISEPPPPAIVAPPAAPSPVEVSRTVAPASITAARPARQPEDGNQPLTDARRLTVSDDHAGARLEATDHPNPAAGPAPRPAGSQASAIQPLPPPPVSPAPESKLPVPVTPTVPRGPAPRDFTGKAETPAVRVPSRRAEPPPPAIHVTIGRVEVRAVPPAAPPPHPAQPTAPRVSLDEYLRGRTGGRR
jgi:hypothetical protein